MEELCILMVVKYSIISRGNRRPLDDGAYAYSALRHVSIYDERTMHTYGCQVQYYQ
jgi:hypothetical protein